MPRPVQPLADGGRRGVVLEQDRDAHALVQPRGQRNVVPAGKRLGVHDVPLRALGAMHGTRDAHTHAGHLFRRQSLRRHQEFGGLDHEIERLNGRREIEVDVLALSHPSSQVDEHAGQVVAVEVEAEGEGTFRVDPDHAGGRPSLLTATIGLKDEAERQQLLYQVRDGLHRELRPVGDVRARQRPEPPHHFVDDAEVVLLGVDEIGAR